MLNPTAITDRSAEAGYPLAFHTGDHMIDRDGAPFLSLLSRRDFTDRDTWTFDRREYEALYFENDRDRYSGELQPSTARYRVAALRRANGYHVDVDGGYVAYGEPHYYPDNRHLIVVHGPVGQALLETKRKHWTEIPDVATGYVYIPDSPLMQAIAKLAMLSIIGGTHDNGLPWASATGLVYVALPNHTDGDQPTTLHIGSMSRRRAESGWTSWTLGG